jgi:hypothetical protein
VSTTATGEWHAVNGAIRAPLSSSRSVLDRCGSQPGHQLVGRLNSEQLKVVPVLLFRKVVRQNKNTSRFKFSLAEVDEKPDKPTSSTPASRLIRTQATCSSSASYPSPITACSRSVSSWPASISFLDSRRASTRPMSTRSPFLTCSSS